MTIMPNTNEIEKIFTPTLKTGAYKPSIFCMIDEPNESSFSFVFVRLFNPSLKDDETSFPFNSLKSTFAEA